MSRAEWMNLTDRELLTQCDVDTYRASGPGGQKRNKTSSAVRLRHGPTGLIVIAEESRSQHDNKAKALTRLRRAFALKLRETGDGNRPELDAIREPAEEGSETRRLSILRPKDERFWPATAVILDILTDAGGQVSTAAQTLGTTTANLIQWLSVDDRVWAEANRLRVVNGLATLKGG